MADEPFESHRHRNNRRDSDRGCARAMLFGVGLFGLLMLFAESGEPRGRWAIAAVPRVTRDRLARHEGRQVVIHGEVSGPEPLEENGRDWLQISQRNPVAPRPKWHNMNDRRQSPRSPGFRRMRVASFRVGGVLVRPALAERMPSSEAMDAARTRFGVPADGSLYVLGRVTDGEIRSGEPFWICRQTPESFGHADMSPATQRTIGAITLLLALAGLVASFMMKGPPREDIAD